MNKEKEMTGAEFILNKLSKCESFIELNSKLQDYLLSATIALLFDGIDGDQMTEDLFRAYLQVILDKDWVKEFVAFFAFATKEDTKKERPRWNRA